MYSERKRLGLDKSRERKALKSLAADLHLDIKNNTCQIYLKHKLESVYTTEAEVSKSCQNERLKRILLCKLLFCQFLWSWRFFWDLK